MPHEVVPPNSDLQRTIDHQRTYNPEIWSQTCSPTDLITYNPEKHVFQFLCFEPLSRVLGPGRYEPSACCRIDESSLVVFIDSECRDWNGKKRAAYGIYFGPFSTYNARGLVPLHKDQTGLRALWEALFHTLAIISSIRQRNAGLMNIKVATPNVQFITYITQDFDFEFSVNDLNLSDSEGGQFDIHFEEFELGYKRLWDLQCNDNQDLKYQFWQVGRERNRNANQMAEQALREEETKEIADEGAPWQRKARPPPPVAISFR